MAKQHKKSGQRKVRTLTKRILRRKRKIKVPQKSIIDVDRFYQIINRVQIHREKLKFHVKEEDKAVFDHILTDLELPFTSKKAKIKKINCCKYTVSPGKERDIDDDTNDIEEFPDEIAEEGQVFFD